MRISSILIAASAVAAPALAEPTVELSTGLEYQEGEYGTGESIEIWTVPTSVRVQSGQVILSATLPYLRVDAPGNVVGRSEEHTSELQSLMRISYAVFCLKKKKITKYHRHGNVA